MRFRELIQGLGGTLTGPDQDPEVFRIVQDSREVRPGDAYLARRGHHTDGHRFIEEAIRRGAVALLVEHPVLPWTDRYPAWIHPELRTHMCELNRRITGMPDRALTLIGVTGTNGKSTTTTLIHHMLTHRGERGGLIGTVVYRDARGREWPSRWTTPESTHLFPLFHTIRSQGGSFVVMEISSHALAERRVACLSFSYGVFLNLTREHLDYHRTLEAYARAKAGLMSRSRVSVINRSSPWASWMAHRAAGEVVFFGGRVPGLRVRMLHPTLRGSWMEIQGHRVFFPHVGSFHRENVGAAMTVLRHMGTDWEPLLEALRTFPGVPGRMERFLGPEKRFAFVDYAHTPDALERALRTLRRLTPGELWVVFGAGGDKDQGKRPMMGAVADQWADRVILTMDNPRSEPLEKINAQIRAGMKRAPLEIQDREEAIRFALSHLPPRSVVLIAGKGHETYQEIQGIRYPYRDQDVVVEAGWRQDRGGRE